VEQVEVLELENAILQEMVNFIQLMENFIVRVMVNLWKLVKK